MQKQRTKEMDLNHREKSGAHTVKTAVMSADSAGVSFAKGVQDAQNGNWGLDRADQSSGTDNTYVFGNATGKGTVLYQIDTGVRFGHSDFAQLNRETGEATGKSRIINGMSMKCTDPNDKAQKEDCSSIWVYGADATDDVLDRVNVIPGEDGAADTSTLPGKGCDAHGTHTASTAAGNRYGVAKEASIVVIQGLSCIATAQDSLVVKALEWVVTDARARKPYMPAVVLLSLGGEKDTVLNEAVKRTTEHHVNVVVAAGNENQDACTETPSAVVAASTVGAVDSSDHLASFSNYGQCLDISAPGSGIMAAYAEKGNDDAVAVLSGTSMAAPFVAGAMLQALQLNPQMTTKQTKQILSCVASKADIHIGLSQVSADEAGTPNKVVRIGDVFSSMEKLTEAVGDDETCKQLVEKLAKSRPAKGVLAKSPDVNFQTVILPDEQVPANEYDADKPLDYTPYTLKTRAKAKLATALVQEPL
jgi:hypothetical protein